MFSTIYLLKCGNQQKLCKAWQMTKDQKDILVLRYT